MNQTKTDMNETNVDMNQRMHLLVYSAVGRGLLIAQVRDANGNTIELRQQS